MKKIFFLIFLPLSAVFSHEHMEVTSASPSNQLVLSGPTGLLALYVPRGEFFSGYLPKFPGGWHASELTFTTELPAADPRVEIVSVTGPAGGSFAFWEAGATSPTWSRPTGWSGNGEVFPVVLGDDNHVHGRAFTMDRPGAYTVTFRVVDVSGAFGPSANMTITFNALQPPQLSIKSPGQEVDLSFSSRTNLNYDLQVCTDLPLGFWTNVFIQAIEGDGGRKEMTIPRSGQTKAFYRLVEYQ
jgi:hypothetical protein